MLSSQLSTCNDCNRFMYRYGSRHNNTTFHVEHCINIHHKHSLAQCLHVAMQQQRRRVASSIACATVRHHRLPSSSTRLALALHDTLSSSYRAGLTSVMCNAMKWHPSSLSLCVQSLDTARSPLANSRVASPARYATATRH